jgi:FkbM family methyltransferase
VRGSLAQNDSRILEYIVSTGILRAPAAPEEPYALANPSVDPSTGQSHIAKKLFKGMKKGFFVECGALDGETRSNTLSLERDFGWQGLLVEGDPKNYDLVIKKNRKAWTAGCCLAVHPYPHEVFYKQGFNVGKIQSDSVKNPGSVQSNGVRVQCFPLFSLLSALGVDTVDFFSLDVEGVEVDVLKTIPFDSVHIKVLTVEFVHGKGGAEELVSFMKGKGYRVVTKLTNKAFLANDIVFAHNTFPVEEEFPPVIESESMMF